MTNLLHIRNNFVQGTSKLEGNRTANWWSVQIQWNDFQRTTEVLWGGIINDFQWNDLYKLVVDTQSVEALETLFPSNLFRNEDG